MRSGSPVTSSVERPIRAAASTASTPAWPPPTTITAASSREWPMGTMLPQRPSAALRLQPGRAFATARSFSALLSYAEACENRVQHGLARRASTQLAERRKCGGQVAGNQVDRVAGFERLEREADRAPRSQHR